MNITLKLVKKLKLTFTVRDVLPSKSTTLSKGRSGIMRLVVIIVFV